MLPRKPVTERDGLRRRDTKKRCPPMPSGALIIEDGRPSIIQDGRPSIIQAPTLSRYIARSSLVTGPCPSSGHGILSGRLRGTPMTTPALEAVDDALADLVRCLGAGSAMSIRSAARAEAREQHRVHHCRVADEPRVGDCAGGK